ncbi:hypothetical protein [Desulfobacula sp.]|uniref:lysophospholipid acyltransferase family protein n=1 Tax=Desulfobacula sp. TaxID=2593537 RepID=UPI0025C0A1C8|nr:hypothetical protein [Desulfobacula sp.]MBC2703070.1 hypothetical protein [Desulfobacula sp.]
MVKKTMYDIQIFFIKQLLLVTNSLSWEFSYKLGHLLGLIIYYSGFRKKVAMVNLDIVYGNTKTQKHKQNILKKSSINLGHVVINYLRLPYVESSFWKKNCRITNEKTLKKLLAKKKGVAIISGHFGMWDLGIGKLGHSDYNFSVIGKRIRNQAINEMVLDSRKRLKMRNLMNKNVMDTIINILKNGGIVGIAVDQRIQKSKGVFLNWMGRPASSVKSTSYIVRETGASVLSAYMVQHGPREFELIIGDEITWEKYPEDPEKELLINSQKQADVVQKFILKKPELWFWMHKRWKIHPDKKSNPYL